VRARDPAPHRVRGRRREQYKKEQIEETAPIHTREFLRKCKSSTLSSRQVRVYEVCDHEETECGPLVACLDNLHPKE
jgi:hypothetical protein